MRAEGCSPGNVRELLNALERATIEDNERSYFTAVLEQTHGKLYGPDGAATIAGLLPTTLRSRLLRLGLR